MKNTRVKYGWSSLMIVAMLLFLQSCGNKDMTYREYLQWVNTEDSGLTQVKQIGNYKWTAKYMTTEFLASKECRITEDLSKEEAFKQYESSLTFLLKMENITGQDLQMDNVQSESEFQIRSYDLNFNIKGLFKLQMGDKEYYPELVNLEDNSGITADRKVHVVFSIPNVREVLSEVREVKFTYNDQLFNTGINHFGFLTDQMVDVPVIVMNSDR